MLFPLFNFSGSPDEVSTIPDPPINAKKASPPDTANTILSIDLTNWSGFVDIHPATVQ